jgi:hypothetical protein
MFYNIYMENRDILEKVVQVLSKQPHVQNFIMDKQRQYVVQEVLAVLQRESGVPTDELERMAEQLDQTKPVDFQVRNGRFLIRKIFEAYNRLP